jgi:hypothetical protein
MPTKAPGTKAPAYELPVMFHAGLPATGKTTFLKYLSPNAEPT